MDKVQELVAGLPGRYLKHAEALESAHQVAAAKLANGKRIAEAEETVKAESAKWSEALAENPAAPLPKTIGKANDDIATCTALAVALQDRSLRLSNAERAARRVALEADANEKQRALKALRKSQFEAEQLSNKLRAEIAALETEAGVISSALGAIPTGRVSIIRGSLSEIEKALEDGREPIDPVATLALLGELRLGRVEHENEQLGPGRATTTIYHVRDLSVFFDRQTGRVLGHFVHVATTDGGKALYTSDHLFVESSELQRLEGVLAREDGAFATAVA